MDYKSVMDRGEKAFTAAMHDIECVVIGYKNENIELRSKLEREKKRNAMLEAKLNAYTFIPTEVKQ